MGGYWTKLAWYIIQVAFQFIHSHEDSIPNHNYSKLNNAEQTNISYDLKHLDDTTWGSNWSIMKTTPRFIGAAAT